MLRRSVSIVVPTLKLPASGGTPHETSRGSISRGYLVSPGTLDLESGKVTSDSRAAPDSDGSIRFAAVKASIVRSARSDGETRIDSKSKEPIYRTTERIWSGKRSLPCVSGSENRDQTSTSN